MTYKDALERRTGLKLAKATRFEVGKRYYIGYWQKALTVLASQPHDIWGTVYEVQWEDNALSINSTRLDPKNDFEIIGE